MMWMARHSESPRAVVNHKLTVPDVIPLMYAVYDRHCVGCCAHIVTDDGNVRDKDAQFCLEQAKEEQHLDCLALCEALVQLSPTQRRKLYRAPRPPWIPEIIRGER